MEDGLLDDVGGVQLGPQPLAQLHAGKQPEVIPVVLQGTAIGFGGTIHDCSSDVAGQDDASTFLDAPAMRV
jgi:hypothetical protein